MADFSGYVAIDELYDGPFCVLSIVDNHTFKRLTYQVLNHDPNHKDITAFLRRFQGFLQSRNLTLRGVTTDASPLYPEPLRTVFGDVPHQICEFHVIKELTKAILGNKAAPAVGALIETMQAPDEDLRLGSALALAQIGKPAVGALIRELENENRTTRYYALAALAWIQGQRVSNLV